MQKILLLLGIAFFLTVNLGRADSAMQSRADATNSLLQAQTSAFPATAPSNATFTGHGSDFVRGLDRAPGASFAQLDGNSRAMPVSMMWLFGLIALGVVAGRIFAVHHAKAMADHEHQTHHARSQMYRMLHQRD